MKNFELNTLDWNEGTLPPELASTNNSLSIVIKGTVVSLLYKQADRSTSECIHLPLYPVAEWIVANWWRLLYECNSQRDINSFQYSHNLSYAGEGYFLPDLLFSPELDVIRAQWRSRSINNGRLSFWGAGVAHFPFADAKTEFSRFVQLVIKRLEAKNIFETPLQNDWKAIETSFQDPEEKRFCIACAQLGLDPYCVSDILADQIIQTDELIGNMTDMNDFYNAVSPDYITESAEWLKQTTTQRTNGEILSVLQDIKEHLPDSSMNPPWKQGYEDAQWVHKSYLGNRQKLQDFLSRITEIFVKKAAPHEFCSALVKTSNDQMPMFAFSSKLNSFLQGRAFGEYLRAPANSISLITKITTPNQKRCRAFAAELVAPAADLRKDLKDRALLFEDDISELAEEYQTSEFVIKYQLENHRLATVVAT